MNYDDMIVVLLSGSLDLWTFGSLVRLVSCRNLYYGQLISNFSVLNLRLYGLVGLMSNE